ncbi:hypothetical protein CRYUN_Cryun28dG0040000 [Craigia yunnanensis]
MYQNDDKSPFQTHGLVMKIFIISVCIYTSLAVAVVIPCTSYSYLAVLNRLGLVLGAFVCDFLLLMLFPPFGYFVLVLCILMLLIITLKSYQQIFKLILDVATLAFNRSRDLLHQYIFEYICMDTTMFLSRSIALGPREGTLPITQN